MLEVAKLDGDVDVRLTADAPPLPARLARAVAESWHAHRLRHPTAFDGRIVSLEAIRGRRLEGRLAAYSHWVAQRRYPELFAGSRVRPLAVTGMLRLAGGLLFARRDAGAVQDPGRWELAPSGALDGRSRQAGDRVSAEAQLAVELGEELNLHWREVERVRAFALVADTETAVVDVGFEVQLATPFARVRRRFADRMDREYDRLELVPPDRIPAFVRERNVAPVSQVMLACSRLAPQPEEATAGVRLSIEG